MNELIPVVYERAHEMLPVPEGRRAVALTSWDCPAGGTPPAGEHNQPGEFIFLDTLAQDIRAALALLEESAWPRHRRPGWSFRLGDVGETLALIDQTGLLPLTKPIWYLRLRDFVATKD